MVNREFSPTRARTSWKPRVNEEDVPLFRCPSCGCVHMGVSDGTQAELMDDGNPKMLGLPYRGVVAPQCTACGCVMERLACVDADDLPDGVKLDFQFRGGFNANCVKVKWSIKPWVDARVEWVLLKTFEGMQLKYVKPGAHSPLVFAFAADDAYCYCDSDPCEECMFRCKFGMAAYVYLTGTGLVRMGFDRMLAGGAGAGNEGLRRSK